MTKIFQITLILMAFAGTIADGPNIHHLQEIYEKSSPGEMPCYYDGSLCKRGEEYCSVRSRTCEPLFPNTIKTEKEKVTFCEDIILNKTVTEQGMLDTCIYFFGMLEIQKGYHFKRDKYEEHMLKLRPGKEYCPAADEYCQLGNEICNSTSGKCQRLFPDTTDDEKRQKCQEVIQRNVTEFYDACIYALGRIQEHSKQTADSHDSSYYVWAVIVTVILAVFVVVSCVFLVFWRRKNLCFGQTLPPYPKRRQAGQSDIIKDRENLRTKLLEEKAQGDLIKDSDDMETNTLKDKGQVPQGDKIGGKEVRQNTLNEDGDSEHRD